jgi:hypothetical protein
LGKNFILDVADVQCEGHGVSHSVDRAWVCGEDSGGGEAVELVGYFVCCCDKLACAEDGILSGIKGCCTGVAVPALDCNVEPLEGLDACVVYLLVQ